MKLRNTISKFITITIVLTALVVVGSIWARQSAAQNHVVTTFLFSVTSFGLVPDQTARLSVGNLPQGEGGGPVRVQAYIYDSYGNLLSRTDVAEVPANQFRTFDVNRNDLRVAGEAGNGRLQLRAGIQVVLMDGSVRPVKDFPVSLEVMDSRTGATTGGNYFTGSVTVSAD